MIDAPCQDCGDNGPHRVTEDGPRIIRFVCRVCREPGWEDAA